MNTGYFCFLVVGNNDGSVDGVKYFSCPPNYGALVPLQYIKNIDQKPTKVSVKVCYCHLFFI